MHTNTEINLGPRLKKQRIDKGFSQAKLSKSIGISPSYLNLIENGKRKIPVALLIKAADELELSIKDFSAESNKRLLSDVMDVLTLLKLCLQSMILLKALKKICKIAWKQWMSLRATLISQQDCLSN